MFIENLELFPIGMFIGFLITFAGQILNENRKPMALEWFAIFFSIFFIFILIGVGINFRK